MGSRAMFGMNMGFCRIGTRMRALDPCPFGLPEILTVAHLVLRLETPSCNVIVPSNLVLFFEA